MAQATVTFRIDENLKKNLEMVCDELGMTMTTAFTIFAKKMAREWRIPFDVSVEMPNAETIAAIEDAQAGRNLYGPFDSVAAMMEALNAED